MAEEHVYKYFNLDMQPRIIILNSPHFMRYNNILQISQSRQTEALDQQLHQLSARSLFSVDQQFSTDCSDMHQQQALTLQKISEQLIKINKRLDKLEAGHNTLHTEQKNIIARIERLQKTNSEQERVQNSSKRLMKNQVDSSEVQNKKSQQNFEGQFRNIQLLEQQFLLNNKKDPCEAIAELIMSRFPRLKMVRLYLFMDTNFGIKQNEKITFSLIRFMYLGGAKQKMFLNYLLSTFSQLQVQQSYKRLEQIKKTFESYEDFPNQTYDFQKLVEILEDQVQLSMRFDQKDKQIFQNMIVVALADPGLFAKLKKIGKFTQILCLVKHISFWIKSSKPQNLLQRLRLTEQDEKLAKQIICSSEKYIQTVPE